MMPVLYKHRTIKSPNRCKRKQNDLAAFPRSEKTNNEDLDHLEHGLKRVRVSPSSTPGELCLQRDIKHMVEADGWRPAHENLLLYDSCSLRHGLCPSELVLCVPDVGAHVHLLIQKSFPHRPPKIMRVDYNRTASDIAVCLSPRKNITSRRRIDSIIIMDELHASSESKNRMHGQQSASQTGSVVVLANWTPIRRLGDCLKDIIEILRYPPAPCRERGHGEQKPSGSSLHDEICSCTATHTIVNMHKDSPSPTNIEICGSFTEDDDAAGQTIQRSVVAHHSTETGSHESYHSNSGPRVRI